MPSPPDPRWPEPPSRSPRRIAADVREELDGWIEERALDLQREGITPSEARRRACAEFGDLPGTHARIVAEELSVERQRRVTRWGAELAADARAALRAARRTPLATSVLVATFALGIGATTAIYSAVHALLVRPLPYAREGTLVKLSSTEGGAPTPAGEVSAGTLMALREQAATLAGVATVAFGGATLTGDGEPEVVRGARLSANFFAVAGVRAALGRTLVAGDDAPGSEPVVVLGDRLWRRRFGADPAVVGRKIDASGTMRRVVGITPPGFVVPTVPAAELFTPLDLSGLTADPNRVRKFRFLHAFARLRDGVTPDAAQRDVDAVLARLAAADPEAYAGLGARVLPVRDAVTGRLRPALLVLMGAALTLLLIACANITVALLTRTMRREHELAVRAALGAGRFRLARQLLVESLTFAAFGGAAGVALGAVLLRLLSVVGASSLPAGTELALDGPVLAFSVALTLLSGVAFGVAPALAGGRDIGGLLATLTTRSTGSRLRSSLRAVLVGGQLALSVALLLSAALLARSLDNLGSLELGYRTERLLSFRVSLPDARYEGGEAEDRFWEALLPRLRAIPGVERVGASGSSPIRGNSGAGLAIEGRAAPDGGRLPEVRYATVSDEYFATLGVPLRSGRTFSPMDRDGAPRVVIINELAARTHWGTADPVGARIRLGPDPGEPWGVVIGVVGNVRERSDGDFSPTAYTSNRQDRWGGGVVMIRTSGDPSSVVPAARGALRDVDPLLPMSDVGTFDAARSEQLSTRRVPMVLMTGFSLVALLLATVGVYGVGANVVALRRREFGIRMALGASHRGVLSLVLKDSARMIAGGVAAGIPLALALSANLRGLLYGVTPDDPALVIGVSVVLAAVALAAALIPARRATRVDPLQALRLE